MYLAYGTLATRGQQNKNELKKMDQNAKQQLIGRLQNSNNVLVTVSANPSVDQLSACIGLTLFLNKLGKHATAVYSGETPQTIDFLKPSTTLENNTNSLRDFIIALDKSKADKLRYKVEDKIVKIFITPYRTSLSQDDLEFSQGDFNVEVVIALGVKNKEDLDRAITAHGRILHDATVSTINIGTGNNNLGSINWGQADASSLCEMAVDLAETLQPGSLDAQMATAFLTGIVAQTDRFSNTKTTPKTMSISSKLMAAGANQQLVSAKLQQPIAKKDAAPDKKPHPGDGTLEIPHDEEDKKQPEPPRELPPIEIPEDVSEEEDTNHQIQIDEHGNIVTTSADSPLQSPPPTQTPAQAPMAPQRLTLNPPTLGGTLTANSRPEQLDPSTDPLSGSEGTKPLLSHEAPPASTTPQLNTHQTLEEIEQKTGSKHVAQAAQQEQPAAPKPEAITNDLDVARQAVEDAAQASVEAPSPIAALGAQPLGSNLNAPSQPAPQPTYTPPQLPVTPLDLPAQGAPQAQPSPMPLPAPSPNLPAFSPPAPAAPTSTGLPPNLVPDKGLPPEQTGVSAPPSAPPPVPPPLMPPPNAQ